MLTRRLLRSYGVSWSRWKGTVLQQCLASPHAALHHAAPSVCLPRFTALQSLTGIHTTSSESAQNQPSDLSEKGIGRFQDEQLSKLLLKPDSPPNARILRVAIIGLPNSGKSTLTNSLMGWRVSSVSSKVHTTRQNTAGIYTQGSTQIVFLDTPGILSASSRKRHNLERSLLIDPERSLHHADLVVVLVDVSNKWTRNEVDPLLLQVLHLHRHIPSVLVLNKVDLMRSKDMLLQITRSLTQGLVDGQPVGVSTKRSRSQQPDLQPLFDAMGQPADSQDSGVSGMKQNQDVSSPADQQQHSQSDCPSSLSEDEAWTTKASDLRESHSEPQSSSVSGDESWKTNNSKLQQSDSEQQSSSSTSEDDSSPLTDVSSGLQQESHSEKLSSLSSSSSSSPSSLSPEDAAWASYFARIREAGRAVAGMKGWPLFRRVFMVSALSGDGVQDIKDYLLDRASPGPWDYHSSLVTSQDPQDLVLLCVKEKLLEHLHHEVPYNIHLTIVLWEVDEDGMFNIIINASAQNRRQVSILLGPRGQTIQKIASEAKQEMMNAFRCEMRLKIVAKTKPPRKR